MDWFPPEPTLGWVQWRLDRLADARLTSPFSVLMAADYAGLCVLERRLLAKQNEAERGRTQTRVPCRSGRTGNDPGPPSHPAQHSPRTVASVVAELDAILAVMAPDRRAPSARGRGWRRTAPRYSPLGPSETPPTISEPCR